MILRFKAFLFIGLDRDHHSVQSWEDRSIWWSQEQCSILSALFKAEIMSQKTENNEPQSSINREVIEGSMVVEMLWHWHSDSRLTDVMTAVHTSDLVYPPPPPSPKCQSSVYWSWTLEERKQRADDPKISSLQLLYLNCEASWCGMVSSSILQAQNDLFLII